MVNHTWEPVKEYIHKHMKIQHSDEEPIYFSEPYFPALETIIDTQHRIIKYMKSQCHTKLYQILIIIDDFADDEQFSRISKLLNQLYIYIFEEGIT